MMQRKLSEQSKANIKKFIIQTPAPQAILNIVRNTKPRGAAFILKSVSVLGEDPSMEMIVNLLKLDPNFGEKSIWATTVFTDEYNSSYVYVIGPDLKDSQRKTKFNVMIVPKSYIVESILGPNETDESKKQVIYESLITEYSLGYASVMMQSELDELKTKVAPLLDKERIKQLEAELAKTKQAISTTTEPPAKTQEVIPTPTTTSSRIQNLLTRLEQQPIKINETSDDVAYIQDLIYRIGMASPDLAEKNDYPEWVAFRDSKAQFGTYGTRTKNFIDQLKLWFNISDNNSDITAEVLRAILKAGSAVNISEMINLSTIKQIVEQFMPTTPPSTKSSTTTQQSLTSTNTTKKPDKTQTTTTKSDNSNKITSKKPSDSNTQKKSNTTINVPSISSQDLKDSIEMDKIWNDMYTVFVKNPNKYFQKYRKTLNDDELGAANYIKKAFNDAWGKQLARLEKSKSIYTVENVKNIRIVVKHIAGLIQKGREGNIRTPYYYISPKTKKWVKQRVNFTWNYM